MNIDEDVLKLLSPEGPVNYRDLSLHWLQHRGLHSYFELMQLVASIATLIQRDYH